MTEDKRRRFESLSSLMDAAYRSFNDRRTHEWKFSLAIWSTLSLLIIGLLQPIDKGKVFPLSGPWPCIVALFTGLFIVFLHGFWNNWASKANRLDNDIRFYYREIMMRECLNIEFEDEILAKIESYPKRHGWSQPSHLVQIFITSVLSTAAVLILVYRAW
ncbi:MAG: hypothetical protein ABIK83_14170 [Candidatus Zixiibacteriota bacterium]